MGEHVFISYKHEDVEFANILIRQIQNAGFKVWIDAEQIRAGENWREAINLAIRDAFALVLVMTPETKSSEYVTYEWAFALGAGVKIIPAMLRPTQVHPQLDMLQYLDFTDRAQSPWDKLFHRLFEIQGQYQPSTVAVSRDAPPAVKKAVDALDSHNAEERRGALKSLAQMDHPAAYMALVGAVRHPVRDVRIDAAFVLTRQANHQDAAAVPGLLDAISDDDVRIRSAAIKALGEIGDAAAVPALMNTLNNDADGDCRWLAAGALGKIGAPAVPQLINALQDADWKVRRSAAEALWGMREPSAVTGLTLALLDKHDVVRQAATGALEAMGDSAVRGLTEYLTSKNAELSRAAANMLNQIGTPDALQALRNWGAGKTTQLDERRDRDRFGR